VSSSFAKKIKIFIKMSHPLVIVEKTCDKIALKKQKTGIINVLN